MLAETIINGKKTGENRLNRPKQERFESPFFMFRFIFFLFLEKLDFPLPWGRASGLNIYPSLRGTDGCSKI